MTAGDFHTVLRPGEDELQPFEATKNGFASNNDLAEVDHTQASWNDNSALPNGQPDPSWSSGSGRTRSPNSTEPMQLPEETFKYL